MLMKISSALLFGFLVLLGATSSAVAQSASPSTTESNRGSVLVSLLQGEEIDLPDDFVARLDGDRLKIALKSVGLAERYPDRDVLVSLIQEDGTKSDLRPDENGELVFEGVKEGLSAIVVASGQAAYAAMAVYAVPGIDNVSVPFDIPVATVDAEKISSNVEVSGTSGSGESARSIADFPARAVHRFRVYLQPDGALAGHVVVPERGFEQLTGPVNLSFFQDGALVSSTISLEDGFFSVNGIMPGLYSVFADGPPGHAAYSFEVVKREVEELPAVASSATQKSRFVSLHESVEVPSVALPADGSPADELTVLIIPPHLMPGVRDAVRESYPTEAALTGGTAPPMSNAMAAGGMTGVGGGGFGGGGGGGIGGGGLGGLLGVAGLATGVAALSDNSDGFNVNLASPISQ